MAAPNVSGIYEIVNIVNGSRYIGSTADITKRWQDHVSCLNRERHHCQPLQRAWLKYGHASFEFRLLEQCPPSDLLAREQAFIDCLNPRYNVCKKAGSSAGVKHTPDAIANMAIAQRRHWETKTPEAKAAQLAKLRSPEHRARSSEVHRGNSYCKGKVRPLHVREKISAALQGTQHHKTDFTVYTVLSRSGERLSGIQIELRRLTGVSGPELCRLIKGKSRSAKGYRMVSI